MLFQDAEIQALLFRYPLKVVVDGKYDVKLYPEDGETTTILNVKRGIISALAVPLLQGDRRKIMVHKTNTVKINEKLPSLPLIIDPKGLTSIYQFQPTIHGKCNTRYSTNSRSSIAADISLTRDLSECDKFVPIRDYTSPLALISGMVFKKKKVSSVPLERNPEKKSKLKLGKPSTVFLLFASTTLSPS